MGVGKRLKAIANTAGSKTGGYYFVPVRCNLKALESWLGGVNRFACETRKSSLNLTGWLRREVAILMGRLFV